MTALASLIWAGESHFTQVIGRHHCSFFPVGPGPATGEVLLLRRSPPYFHRRIISGMTDPLNIDSHPGQLWPVCIP